MMDLSQVGSVHGPDLPTQQDREREDVISRERASDRDGAAGGKGFVSGDVPG